MAQSPNGEERASAGDILVVVRHPVVRRALSVPCPTSQRQPQLADCVHGAPATATRSRVFISSTAAWRWQSRTGTRPAVRREGLWATRSCDDAWRRLAMTRRRIPHTAAQARSATGASARSSKNIFACRTSPNLRTSQRIWAQCGTSPVRNRQREGTQRLPGPIGPG